MDFDSIVSKIHNAGIAGAGGAGFPSYAKLSKSGIDTIILNCAECEPLLSVDKLLLAEYAKEVFTALKIVSAPINSKVIIAVKKSYEKAVRSCEQQISNFEGFELHLLPDIYPTGDEVSLIYECTKRIVPEGKIPIAVGVVVYNVETALNFYNAFSSDEPSIYKYVTVAGEVGKPVTLKTHIGVKFSELLKEAGGIKSENCTIIAGGPMTGRISSESAYVTKSTKGILVLPDNSFVVSKKKQNPKTELRNAMSICSQCRMCTDLCPRYLLGHGIEPHKFMRAAAMGTTYDTEAFIGSLNCCECGVCEMYACHQNLSPRKLLAECKSLMRQKGVKQKERQSYTVNPMYDYRRLNEHRLIWRLGLNSHHVPEKITDITGKTTELSLLLSQAIGAPSAPYVKKGDTVKIAELVANAQEGKLSIPLHSPIDGIVSNVTEKEIVISKNGKQKGAE